MLTLIVFTAAFVLIFGLMFVFIGFTEHQGAPETAVAGNGTVALLALVVAATVTLIFEGTWTLIAALIGFFGMGG